MNAKTIAVLVGIVALVAIAALLLRPAPVAAPVAPPAGGDLSSDLNSVDALLNTTELPQAPDVNSSVAAPF